MAFYPEGRFPKKGLPVYDGSGEQRNISDPRFRYQDGFENTSKPQISSTDDIFYTKEAAIARSLQLGCNGYHTATMGERTVYIPCSTSAYYDLRMDQFESALNFTYIGNYRVLSWDKPFERVSEINGWNISAGLSVNEGIILDSQDIAIDFRYSVDGQTWSLWTNVGTALAGLSESEDSNNTSEIFKIPLDPAKPFYPEFRFTSVLINDDGSIAYQSQEPIDPSVVILDFDIDLEYDYTGLNQNTVIQSPHIRCSDEKSDRPVVFDDCAFTFDPYAINVGINLYQDLSLIVNKVFGFDVNYYSVQPQARGKDVILKEYTLFNVVDEKCLKVVVPQNQFPDNKINYDPFGLQFEDPFEIHIDKKYFEQIFGKNSQPRKRDIIYFPLTNRIYEINSTYLFRDFMYSPVYFKIELKKYSPKSNTYFNDPAYKEELEGIGLTTSELFGTETQEEELKTAKPKQYNVSSQRRIEDPNRSYIYDKLSIIGFDLNNNWTIVFNNYYDMETSFVEDSDFPYAPQRYKEAVRYKSSPLLEAEGELSYTSWFNLRNFYGDTAFTPKASSPLPVVIDSVTSGQIVYNTHPYKHNLKQFVDYSGNPDGYVAVAGDGNHSGGFEVVQILDEYRFTVSDYQKLFAVNTSGWRIQKAQARNLIHGMYEDFDGSLKGIHIDLIHSGVKTPEVTNFIGQGSIAVRINDFYINSKLQFTPDPDSWYAIAINISNKYQQMSVNIWEMSYDPTNPQSQSSDLKKVHEDVRALTQKYTFSAPEDIEYDNNSPYYGTDNNSYKIYTSPIYISNIRLFKDMIDIDKQSIVLNQNIVRDEHLAYIIDNVKPQLKLPKFGRNR